MAPVATGVKVVNSSLLALGVSGDGDTASIGLGGFAHLIRRNVPMIYIIENNGVYGLTKGQFSATADIGTTSKAGIKNVQPNIDLCSMAIDLGCGFVARSFSGDNKQLTQLLLAAYHHEGTVVIDIISPCVTFANHAGSTKSFSYAKEHISPLHKIGFVEDEEEITHQSEDGETTYVKMHDGSVITLQKLDCEHDVTSKQIAIDKLLTSRENKTILTGLIYHDESKPTLLTELNLSKKPLVEWNETLPDKHELLNILKAFK